MDDFREVKVHFNLDIEEDGFPPVSAEYLNGYSHKEGVVRLDNTPFFALDVALGDTVECDPGSLGRDYQFKKILSAGGNKAISIIFIEEDIAEEIFQYLKKLGCYCEFGQFDGFDMLAVCVYKDQDYAKISAYLDQKEADGAVSYAELCV